MPRAGQRGQSLVETALALPVLLALVIGLLQLGLMAWERLMLQHAAHCAARAYSVWMVKEPALALAKAERAARLALRGAPRPRSLSVTRLASAVITVYPKIEAQRLHLQGQWDPLLRMPPWRNGVFLSAQSGILSEAQRAPSD